MTISITGYSERGMINALCEDIVRANSIDQLTTFLSWCSFPNSSHGSPDFSGIKSAQLFVEQGFSDFGDPDLLILLDHADRRQAVFIEAKVSTVIGTNIEEYWQRFIAFINGNRDFRSSLFVQLYRKLRLIERVANLNCPLKRHEIWGRQSLGANPVVLKAAEILAQYRANPWYVALVPDESSDVRQFFSTTLRGFTYEPSHLLPGWDCSRIGFLTWPDFHNHVQTESEPQRWSRSHSSFAWNESQIYPRTRATLGEISVGYVSLWDGERVIIVGTGERSLRVVFEHSLFDGVNFPRSFLVRKERLIPLNESIADAKLRRNLPNRGGTYRWNPGAERNQPRNRAKVPPHSLDVKIIRPGWKTTAVVAANPGLMEKGNEFYVFTHHLLRQECKQ